MIKIEKSTIKIKGKDYNFLKPTAVDLIEIEDKCLRPDGTVDGVLYNELMLGLVSRTLKIDDLVEFVPQDVELSDGNVLSLPQIPYKQWVEILTEIGGFSRVKLAKAAIASTGVSGDITLEGFKYEDIDSLAMAFFSLYETEELREVVEEISTFCFS